MISASEPGSQHLGILWVLNLDESSLASVAPRIATAFQRVGPEAASTLTRAMELDNSTVVLQRFANRKRCYAGKVEGKLAPYASVTFYDKTIGELDFTIRLQ